MTEAKTGAGDAIPSTAVPAGPGSIPFRDEKECLDAWFAALGPMNGNKSSGHASLFQPISERMPALRLLADRSRATRRAGITLRFLDAFDGLGLDLLDRLLLLALLRDAVDIRAGRGLTLA